tara:strand:- start:665 stop:1873 length:1209 start_codon:yes stop_codon:yes gene_type:complete
MAKKKKQETAEKAVEKVDKKVDDTVTKVDLEKFEIKEEDNVTKVDLNKKPENETTEKTEKDNVDDTGVVELVEDTSTDKEQKEVQQEEKTQEPPVIEEIKNEKVEEKVEQLVDEAEEAIAESIETGKKLPENIQKLMDFMEETGGDINDYVKLNQDYSKLDNLALLREYYQQTKPHLDSEEIDFLMEDEFSYDEEEDEARDIRRKKLALKEQVASAKAYLDGQKSKYYEEIKAGSKLTNEQQKAIDFFNRYNKESKEQETLVKQQTRTFLNKTNQLFNKNFKGFEYNVGDKKYRFNVKDVDTTKTNQSDINNFVKKFLNEKNEMQDAAGYHKGLFTAMNADAIAKHFYEQGKADAMKDSVAKSKNVNMNPRQSYGQIETGGIKVRALGDSSSDFKFKIKNKK